MIHPNVCFLILLICCWVVTASLMAEKTNVGVAVFVADNTYVCGCGSDGATALLSACSLVRCCSHQFVFPCLEVLLQGTPPPCTISCKTLPGHSVGIDTMSWEGLAADRTGWRSALKQHLKTGEDKLMTAAADKASHRHIIGVM